MVERYRRGKGKQKLLGNHQKCWIWGRNVVVETLKAGRWPILELCLANRLAPDALQSVQQLADAASIPVSLESNESLTQRCRSKEHQGYLAKMPPYPYADPRTILADQNSRPLYCILDSIQDPYNFGAIIRSANVMGIDAMFVSRSGQVEVTSLVARASAGAVNYLPIAAVADLVELATDLHSREVQVVAATSTAERTVFEHDFQQSTAIVVGNEGTGIHAELLRVCDHRVAIPQFGEIDSLNAAVSAGILFYEACRQRAADNWGAASGA